MDLPITQLLILAPGLLLHFVRAGAFMITCPLFGTSGAGRMLRLVLAVSIGAMFWWTSRSQWIPMPPSALELALMVARETLIGFVVGFTVRLALVPAMIGGEILAAEMGFAMARIVNPATGTSSSPMSQLYELLGMMLIFATGLHHVVLRILDASYDTMPVGRAFDYALLFDGLRPMFEAAITLGLMFAMPMLGVLIMLTVVLVLLARAVPNINLMEFSFGLRILLALFGSVLILGRTLPFLHRAFESLLGSAQSLFEAM